MKTSLYFAGLARATMLAALLAACASAGAQQSENDIQALKARTGPYAVDCSKPDTTRLLISVKSLSIVAGKKRVDGVQPMYALTYFGRNPPPNAVAAYLGQPARSGAPGVAFIEWTDRRGEYLTVESDKALEGLFGKPALAGKFRLCKPKP